MSFMKKLLLLVLAMIDTFFWCSDFKTGSLLMGLSTTLIEDRLVLQSFLSMEGICKLMDLIISLWWI